MISVYCFLAAVLEGSLVAVLAATRDHGPGLICNFFLDCFLGFRNVGDAKNSFISEVLRHLFCWLLRLWCSFLLLVNYMHFSFLSL
jgi:hypothetical protein